MADSSIWSPGESGGIPGPPGQAATIQVGTVSTGAEGTSAQVTNVGDNSNAIFDFVIPRGNTGIGAQGPVGPPGESIQGPPGLQGQPGIQGIPGTKIIAGVGIPSSGIGSLGDYFLAQDTAFLYGPRAETTWPGTYVNLRSEQGVFEDFIPVTGNTITVTNTTNNAIISPATTLATLTLNLPPSSLALNGQVISLFFQGFAITALTLQSTGSTIRGGITTAAANSFASFKFRLSNNTWYRIA